MQYKDPLVVSFADRTWKNLEIIRDHVKDETNPNGYDVTQLVNSLLGLLILPKEQLWNRIPTSELSELATDGWPRVEPIVNKASCNNLRQLLRLLRNAVAHYNLDFISDADDEIVAVKLWNLGKRRRTTDRHGRTVICTEVDFEVVFGIEQLERLAMRLSELIKRELALPIEESAE